MNPVEEGVANFRAFHNEVREYITEQKTIEEQRDKEHKSNTTRLNLIIGILTLIALYIGVILSLRNIQKSQLDPHHVFHSQNPPAVVASEAKIPPL